MALHYNISIENMFSVLGDLSDIEVAWTSISDTIRAVIKNTIGYKRPHRKPWLSEEAVDTINAKAWACLVGDEAEHKQLQGIFRAKVKHNREAYYKSLAIETEDRLHQNNLKVTYRTIMRHSRHHSDP